VRALDEYVYPLPAFSSLPPLPPVSSIDVSQWVGPTEESNWVIFPCLLVGAYPSSTHDPTNTAILTSLLKLGVTTFVCLQLEYQHEGVTEAQWRSGAKLRPYIFDAIKLVDTLPASFFSAEKGKPAGLEFVHFPILGAQKKEGGPGAARAAPPPPLQRPLSPARPAARLRDCKRRQRAAAGAGPVRPAAARGDNVPALVRARPPAPHAPLGRRCHPPPHPLPASRSPPHTHPPTPTRILNRRHTPAAGAATAARAPWCR
jgi:hypothetical protein